MPSLSDFLSRIQIDHEFYFQFRKNPDKVLAAYELSTEERAVLSEPGRQLWKRLEKIGQDTDSTDSSSGDRAEADSRVSLTWRLLTTQTWRPDVHHHSASVGPRLDQGAALERPEVRQAVAQVKAANTRDDKLAAISALIEHLD
jgi:hypothetical protein